MSVTNGFLISSQTGLGTIPLMKNAFLNATLLKGLLLDGCFSLAKVEFGNDRSTDVLYSCRR